MAHRQAVQVRCTVQTSDIDSSPWTRSSIQTLVRIRRTRNFWVLPGGIRPGIFLAARVKILTSGVTLDSRWRRWDDPSRGGHCDGPPPGAPEPSPVPDGSDRGRSRRGWDGRLGRDGVSALPDAGAAPDAGVPRGVSRAIDGGARRAGARA